MFIIDEIIGNAGSKANGQVVLVGEHIYRSCPHCQPVGTNGFGFTYGCGKRQLAGMAQFMKKGIFFKQFLCSIVAGEASGRTSSSINSRSLKLAAFKRVFPKSRQSVFSMVTLRCESFRFFEVQFRKNENFGVYHNQECGVK